MIEWTDELAEACANLKALEKKSDATVLEALKALQEIEKLEPRMIGYEQVKVIDQILKRAPIKATEIAELKSICFEQLCEEYPSSVYRTVGRAIIVAEQSATAANPLDTNFADASTPSV
jgi:hypothetical protein